MICCQFHPGSGLGDMLHRYITVRTLAEEKGYDFGVLGKENFKGDSFMSLDMGNLTEEIIFNGGLVLKKWLEKDVREYGTDIRSYDPEINFIEDNTIIDGSFEDSKYWHHNLANINKWLAVEPLTVPDDLCVIGFRGGEYATQPDLFLPPIYYGKAMQQMPATVIKYQVHTDDPMLAKKTFEGSFFEVVENEPISHSKHTNMAFNWRSARFAKYAIIPNSAFFIIPRLLKHLEDPTAVTIAPRGWSRRNIAKGNRAGNFLWARPACYYKEFSYI